MLQDTIPVFMPNQALTADHLNDLRIFLDQQDRLTRRALIGIGVMCGFGLDVDSNGRVHIGKGVAITSEGHVLAEDAVVCDRYRNYQQPLPSGANVTPQALTDARYPYLFFDGTTQIPAWEMLTTDVQVPANEPAPSTLTSAFLADKTVMLFLECTEEALRNCSINDCNDQGAELQFTLRRLLVQRSDADRMLAAESELAGRPTDPASHPGLGLPYLRVEDLGLARNGIGTFPALLARVLQIAGRFSADLPQAFRDAYSAYRYLLEDMYPASQFPNGPFPNDYFGNVWGNLAEQPYLAQYFYDYMLDASMAYNEFVAKARAYHAECLPDPDRFPKHVLLGDPIVQARGFVAEVASPADFAAYDPLLASTGFGPRPNPPRRRAPWTPADRPPVLDDIRALFHRLTLLAHAFQLRGLLTSEIRVTPSRHDAWAMGERCIPPYYAITMQSDLFRVWSPEKTRANLLSTVYSHPFSQRNANHPYLYRIDGEDFYGVGGHVGKDLATVMRELIVHKRVLGLDFAIEPVWMGLGLADNARTQQLDSANMGRAMQAMQRLLFCRMGDVEVILLGLLAALFAFLVYVLRGVGRQMAVDHASMPQQMMAMRIETAGGAATETAAGETLSRSLADEDIARLVSMARIDAVRRPQAFSFAATRLSASERQEINTVSKDLLSEFRATRFSKGRAAETLAADAGDQAVSSLYLRVQQEDGTTTLFEKVRNEVAQLDIANDQRAAATDRVYNAVALMDATEDLMAQASVSSLAEFDTQRFETTYVAFSDRLNAYAQTAPVDPAAASNDFTVNTNIALTDYAPAVAAQRTTFSSAGFLGEIQRRILALFQDLTLEGYGRRHPGLEHRAGVPKGGTLVLAYASKQEFLTLMRLVAPRLDQLSNALDLSMMQGGLTAAIANASQEVLAAAGPTGEDPLSDFVVLADFCLSSQCCDSDCSDIAFEHDLPEGLFDLDQPGRMAVDPVIPNGTPGTSQNGGGVSVNDTIAGLLSGIGLASRFEAVPRRSGTIGRNATPAPSQPANPPRDGNRPRDGNGNVIGPTDRPVSPAERPSRPEPPDNVVVQPNQPRIPRRGPGGVVFEPIINNPLRPGRG